MAVQHALSTFDIFTLVISAAGASVLWRVRILNGRQHAAGQWIGDALTVGALVVIVAIGVNAVIGPVWNFADVAKANVFLIAIAFLYSAGMLVISLCKSAARDGKGD